MATEGQIIDTPEALRASHLQLAEEQNRANAPVPFVPRHAPTHSAMAEFHATMAEAAAEMAAKKNVPLTSDECSAVAHQAILRMPRSELDWLLEKEPDAVAVATRAINHVLDVLAICRFAYMVTAVEGAELPSPETMTFIAERHLAAQSANDLAPYMRVWPDLIEAVTKHFAAKRRAEGTPVPVTLFNATFLVKCPKPMFVPRGLTPPSNDLTGGNDG